MVATLKIEIFEFFLKDATKNLLFGLHIGRKPLTCSLKCKYKNDAIISLPKISDYSYSWLGLWCGFRTARQLPNTDYTYYICFQFRQHGKVGQIGIKGRDGKQQRSCGT